MADELFSSHTHTPEKKIERLRIHHNMQSVRINAVHIINAMNVNEHQSSKIQIKMNCGHCFNYIYMLYIYLQLQ